MQFNYFKSVIQLRK